MQQIIIGKTFSATAECGVYISFCIFKCFFSIDESMHAFASDYYEQMHEIQMAYFTSGDQPFGQFEEAGCFHLKFGLVLQIRKPAIEVLN